MKFYNNLSCTSDGNDGLDLPPVLQDELTEAFEKEKNTLLQRIEHFETEIANSQAAFDKYRERARESLLKTASELNTAEMRNKGLKDQIKVCC